MSQVIMKYIRVQRNKEFKHIDHRNKSYTQINNQVIQN